MRWITLTRIIINEDQFLVKQKDLLSARIISPKFWAPGQIAAHFTVNPMDRIGEDKAAVRLRDKVAALNSLEFTSSPGNTRRSRRLAHNLLMHQI
jgi:hypothetical protein